MQVYIKCEFRAVDSQLQIEGDSMPLENKLIAAGILAIFLQKMDFEDT